MHVKQKSFYTIGTSGRLGQMNKNIIQRIVSGTVVPRFSGLRFSGLSLFSVPCFCLAEMVKSYIQSSGPSRFSGPFGSNGLSPLNRDTTVLIKYQRLRRRLNYLVGYVFVIGVFVADN